VIREWVSKLLAKLARRGDPVGDLDEEMEAHLQFEVDENLATGMTPEDARAASRRRFGNLTSTKERAREAWGFPALETILQDLRYGLRGIRRSPSFSLVVILTLALGIGANTAIFSVVYSVLLKPLPYPDAERLVRLGESDPRAQGISVTWINYQHWRKDNHTFEDLAGFESARLTLTGRGEALLTSAATVTSSFFGLVGMRPLIGRVFTEADERPGAPFTILLSHRFWTGKLGGDPKVLGTALVLDGKPYQVIGVATPALAYFPRAVDFYLPLGLFKGETINRSQHGSMRVLGRLKPGMTLAVARADLDLIMRRLAQADPGPEDKHSADANFLAQDMTREIRPALLMLLGAVGLVLLIACANVASLTLARSTARAREIAVRTAIGAGRMRLIRQLLTENLLIAALGGLSGLLFAQWGLHALIGMGPREIPRLAEITLDFQVLLFAGAITVLTGLVAGLAPALTAGKLDLVSALKESSRSATGAKSGQSLRSALVVAEIAVTLVLAFASGLLLESLIAAQTSNPGFAPERLLALELVLPSSSYKSHEAVRGFYDRLTQHLRNLPGVASVGAVNCPPSAGDCGDWFYSVLDRPAPAQGEVPVSLFNVADPAYFRTMRIPLREGRGFTDADRAGAPRVAIVNENFARRWWSKESAVGRRIKVGGPYIDGPIYEIVGVAGNVSQMGLDAEPLPEIYQPFLQAPSEAMVVMMRATGDPASLAAVVRRRVAEIDHNLPIESLQVFEKSLAATLERRRFSTLLLTLFAGLAMILAAVGIYGLLNYWVSVREGDIAIRLALGAQRSAILRWVGWQALRLAARGIALGALAGWAASHWIESLVFGVSARNPATMATAALAVLAIAVLAAAVPVWRATHVDTVRKLHHA
jgi:predicted permease